MVVADRHRDVIECGQRVAMLGLEAGQYADARLPSAMASLAKGGLAAVVKSLAIEYAARGIRVNAVSPGTIRTPL